MDEHEEVNRSDRHIIFWCCAFWITFIICIGMYCFWQWEVNHLQEHHTQYKNITEEFMNEHEEMIDEYKNLTKDCISKYLDCKLDVIEEREKFDRALEKLKMFEIVPDRINFTINGLAWSSKHIYCVSTLDRPQTAVQQTDYHENCHILVYDDYNHFCNREED